MKGFRVKSFVIITATNLGHDMTPVIVDADSPQDALCKLYKYFGGMMAYDQYNKAVKTMLVDEAALLFHQMTRESVLYLASAKDGYIDNLNHIKYC
jgi:hypothetical protein